MTGHRSRSWTFGSAVAFTATFAPTAGAAEAALEAARAAVRGGEVAEVELDGERVAWGALERARAPGTAFLRWHVKGGDGGGAVEVPTCAGRGAGALDGAVVAAPDAGPLVVPLSAGEHVLSVRVTVSGYERRIACGAPARVGAAETLHEGLLRLTFPSPHADAGGGKAALFVPPNHDATKPGPLLVLLHPWNGSLWTYAAYTELLDEAARRDVVLLFPSGLGNSLYTAARRRRGAARPGRDRLAHPPSTPRASRLAGASMGGAGATTIGLHAPDRFASITSFFGDSKYDLSTYVKAILHDDAAAHLVNALDIADNARSVPVWLVHGEDEIACPLSRRA